MPKITYQQNGPRVLLGDCIHLLERFQDEVFTAVVTDPPYGINFMGKTWDNIEVPGGVASTGSGIDFKAGATGRAHSHGLAGHRPQAFQAWCTAWATEVLRVCKPGAHLLAFGGTRTFHRLTCAIENAGFEIRDCLMWLYGSGLPKSLDISKAADNVAGAELARRWDGWGTSLKPA